MRSTSKAVRPFDLRCLVHFPINGGHNERNHFCDIGNCANGRNCCRSVHFMPRGIYSRCHGLHNHSRRRMPIGPHINWHSNQLYRVQPRRFVHHVRAREYDIQRQHRVICIRTGLRNGIKYKPSHHDAHRTPWGRGVSSFTMTGGGGYMSRAYARTLSTLYTLHSIIPALWRGNNKNGATPRFRSNTFNCFYSHAPYDFATG